MAGVEVDTFRNIKNQQAKQDYKSRLQVIRNPNINHMSRTRTKIDRFVNKEKSDGGLSPTGKRRKKASPSSIWTSPLCIPLL